MSEGPQEFAGGASIWLSNYELRPGDRFGIHSHAEHQLCWAASGVLDVTVDHGCWVLPPTLALWIPSGANHDVGCVRPASLHNLYFAADHFPLFWRRPTVVAVTPLIRELVNHLAGWAMAADERARAEAFLYDLLRPITVQPLRLTLPEDQRAQEVARALLADPADDRTIDDWGRQVGASGRTLARRFVAETGLTLAEWRAQARLRAAMGMLAEGAATAVVAGRVGYRNPSAFAAAFRRAFGHPPSRFYEFLAAPPDPATDVA